MATIAPTIEKLTDDLIDLNVEDQLLTFTKYSVLAPELREHALSYAKLDDLEEYSQCSKLCNSEIQKYNIKAPFKLFVSQDRDTVQVELSLYYKRGVIEKEFANAECDSMANMCEYVQKMHRYVEKSNIEETTILMKKWPSELMQLDQLSYVKKMDIGLDYSMWDEFVHFAQTTKMRLNELTLVHGFYGVSVIPSNFFKSELIKSVGCLSIEPNMQIDKEDFVNSSWKWCFVNNWIDIDIIQEKFLKLSETNAAEPFNLNITLPETESRVFDLNELFPVDRFGERRIYPSHVKIGASIIVDISEDKKIIDIHYK